MILNDYPGHLWALLTSVLCLVLLIAAYRTRNLQKMGFKRWLLALLVFVPIMVLLVLLWDPSRPEETKQKEATSVLVFFDSSKSMSIEDARGLSRLDKAVEVFTDKFAAGFRQEKPYYQFYGFDSSCYSADSMLSLKRWGAGSDLSGVWSMIHEQMQAVKNDKNPELGGIIVFTDGQVENQTAQMYMRLDKNKSVQVMLVGVGSEKGPIDVYVNSVKCPSRVAVKTTYTVTANIGGAFDTEMKRIEVECYQNANLVAAKEIILEKRNPEKQVEFDVPGSAAGTDIIRILAKSKSKELNLVNNSKSKIVQVVTNDKLKVLLYSQVANFNIGRIRQALLKDKKIDLDFRLDAVANPSVLRHKLIDMANTKFPAKAEVLNRYDIIILGPVDFRNISEEIISNIYNFIVSRGGSVVFLPGHNQYSLLASNNKQIVSLVPVSTVRGGAGASIMPATMPIDITKEGNALELFNRSLLKQANLITMASYSSIEKKPAASTLLSVDGEPLLCLQRVGRGYTALLNSHLIYQWYDSREEGGVLADLMSVLTSYVGQISADESRIELAARPDSQNKNLIFEAIVRDMQFKPVDNANVLMEIDGDIIKLEQISPGRYSGQVGNIQGQSVLVNVKAESGGKFLGRKSMVIDIPQRRDEMARVEANKDFLKSLAKEHGIGYMDINEVDGKTADIFRAFRFTDDRAEIISMWHRWPIVLLLCGLLTMYWFARRASSLV